MNNFFFNLTPDVVIKSVEKTGLEPTGHCMALNSYENRVYDLKLVDGSHVVSKFYRPGRWSKEMILEEHEFLYDLKNDEIPVCAPLEFSGSSILETEGIYYSIWPRTGGRIKDEFNDGELRSLGRLLARIHTTGSSKKADHRSVLTGENFGIKPLEFLLNKGFIPDHCAKKYEESVREIVSIYDSLKDGVPFHRIHGDCHIGNLLNGSEGWFFLDFDDFVMGPAVQDIWMLVPARDDEGQRQKSVLIDAYREMREFDVSWLKLVEPLRALRYISYAAWIARRWEDPAFPAAFPQFGTVKYWEEQTDDLVEQIKYFYKNTSDLPDSVRTRNLEEEADGLTNKDYFWDYEENK